MLRGRRKIISNQQYDYYQKKYNNKMTDRSSVNFAQYLINNSEIQETDIFGAYLFFRSCKRRWQDCQSKERYIGVNCPYSGYRIMAEEIISNRRDLFEEFLKLTPAFIESGYNCSLRASIDRISDDPTIGYRLDNIQVVTHGENTHRAVSKIIYALEISDQYNNKSVKQYNTIAEFKEHFGNIPIDTGELYKFKGKEYLIQSDAVLHNKKNVNLKKEEEFGDAHYFVKVNNGIVPAVFMDRLSDGTIAPLQVRVSRQIKLNELIALPKSKIYN